VAKEGGNKKPAVSRPQKGAYHHGELPDRLMDLAVGAIEIHGTEALSLRALAREAGVSATAPYRHFPSKRCLLAGIATQGFKQLTAKMEGQLAEIEATSERFLAMGLAYVEFAVANPVPYNLMFGSVIADFSDYEMLQEASEQCYAQLLRELRVLIEEYNLDISDIELGAVVWSGVHGMASLMINSQRMPDESSATSLPGQSMSTLHQNTERSMMVMFGHFIDDSSALH